MDLTPEFYVRRSEGKAFEWLCLIPLRDHGPAYMQQCEIVCISIPYEADRHVSDEDPCLTIERWAIDLAREGVFGGDTEKSTAAEFAEGKEAFLRWQSNRFFNPVSRALSNAGYAC